MELGNLPIEINRGDLIMAIGAMIMLSSQFIYSTEYTTVENSKVDKIANQTVEKLEGKCLTEKELLKNYSLNYFQKDYVIGKLSSERKLITRHRCGFKLSPLIIVN